MKTNSKKLNGSKSLGIYVVLFILLSTFSSLFIGKIIASSVTLSLENPYHFEKVVAVIVRVEKIESASNSNDYYIRYARYVDEDTGIIYEAFVPGQIYDKIEAESHIGEKKHILIDRKYGIAINYSESASKAKGIDIIVFSVLLVICLSIVIVSIVKLTKKNKKHWIWIAGYIFVMLGLAACVAYQSFDMNYLDQLLFYR